MNKDGGTKYLPMAIVIVVAVWATWIFGPKERVVYRDKPQSQPSDCQLPLPVGSKGSPLHGELGGIPGVVVGKINNPTNLACAYYVKFTNKDIWNGAGVHYQPVNAENFVGVSR